MWDIIEKQRPLGIYVTISAVAMETYSLVHVRISGASIELRIQNLSIYPPFTVRPWLESSQNYCL